MQLHVSWGLCSPNCERQDRKNSKKGWAQIPKEKIFSDDIFQAKACYPQQPPIVCSLPFPSRRVLCPQMGCRASNFYCLLVKSSQIYSYHQIDIKYSNLKEHECMIPFAQYLECSGGNHLKARFSRKHFVYIMTLKQSTIELMSY